MLALHDAPERPDAHDRTTASSCRTGERVARRLWDVSGVLPSERAAERAAVNIVEQLPVAEVEIGGTWLLVKTARPDVVARYLAAFAGARDIEIVESPRDAATICLDALGAAVRSPRCAEASSSVRR